jgi:hypothetical protein
VAVLGVYPGTPSNFNRVWVIPILNFRFHVNLQIFISHARRLQK